MFFYQQLLNHALAGIDSTAMISAVVNVGYGILLVGFLIGLYQAVMSGGDVRALAITAIKYLVVAIILANWSTIFKDVNNSVNSVAQAIGNSSGDVFLNWDKQLGQQFSDSSLSWWDIISGDIASLISVFLIVIAYIFFVISVVLFRFFYTVYGSVLYVLGPLVIALLPMVGVGQIGKTFATNVMIWNCWGIIYAVFGALITAIHLDQVQAGTGGFLGFFEGPLDPIILGLISIFYAISIAVIPWIASRMIQGDVGSAAAMMVRAAANTGGIMFAGASGFAAGASSGASGSGAASSSAAGSSSTSSSGGPGTTAPMSSSTPPPSPSLGQSIRSGLSGAMASNTSPSSSNSSQAQASAGSGSSSTSSAAGAGSGSSSSGSPKSGSQGSNDYYPRGVAQNLAHRAGKAAGKFIGNS